MEAHFCSEKYQRIEFIFVDTTDQLLFVTTSVAVNIKDSDDGENSVDLSHFEDLHQILRNMVNIRNIFKTQVVYIINSTLYYDGSLMVFLQRYNL